MLRVENLDVEIAGVDVLRKVSFTLTAGNVTVLDGLPGHARADLGLGYAPEDRRLIPDLSVEENILVSGLARKLPAPALRPRLDEVYDLLPQLATLRARPAGGVSGGQGKIVALGRALMIADKVLMLDEPFQGLAPALALDYARTLRRCHEQKRDIAILVTESTPKFLAAIASETLQIERGEFVGSA